MAGLTDSAIADDAAIQPHKILGALGLNSIWGKVVYVQSTHVNAGDGGVGSFTAPYRTIMGAVSKITQDNVTVIVGPGHAEAIASATSIGTLTGRTGIQILGCGRGNTRPTITCSSSTSARAFTLSGNDLLLRNIRMVSAVAAQVAMITVYGDDVTIADCVFDYSGSGRTLDAIVLSAGATRTKILGCEFIGSQASGQDSAIHCEVASVDRLAVEDCLFDGAYAQAVIENITQAMTNVRINRNRLMQFASGIASIKADAATTGLISYNGIWSDVTAGGDATIINAAGCRHIENYAVDSDASKSGKLTPSVT